MAAAAASGPPAPEPQAHAAADSIGLYIHVPFCRTKCNYCDFNTYAGIERLEEPFAQAAAAEIGAWGKALDRPPADTLFFGGGTPSYLNPATLRGLLGNVRDAFRLQQDAEATMEANPDDISAERAEEWLEMGFNRVSMGAQSFSARILQQMSRRHGAAQIGTAFSTLRSAGFRNASLDLIYGWPGQTLQQWRQSIQRALELQPSHLSLYALQVERATPLSRMVAGGQLPPPDDDRAADMYELAEELLPQGGLRQYEISNWAQPGAECRHNLKYWNMQPYLGVGPGAHSFLQGWRFSNIKPPLKYISAAQQAAEQPATQHLLKSGLMDAAAELSRGEAMGETMMMGLRLREGVPGKRFQQRFGISISHAFEDAVAELQQLELIRVDADGGVALRKRARLVANEVFARFLDDAASAPPAESAIIKEGADSEAHGQRRMQ